MTDIYLNGNGAPLSTIPTSKLLYFERIASDLSSAVADNSDVGPLGNTLLALENHAHEIGVGPEQFTLRHMDPKGAKLNRVRWDILNHLDIRRNSDAIDSVTIDAIEKSVNKSAPTLKEEVDVNAEGISLSDPAQNGDKFIEIEFAEPYRSVLYDEARGCLNGLSHIIGKDRRIRVIRPRIRMAWIKHEAPEGFVESLYYVAKENFDCPMGILLTPALPLRRPLAATKQLQSHSSNVAA
jgi:hypothetical protein